MFPPRLRAHSGRYPGPRTSVQAPQAGRGRPSFEVGHARAILRSVEAFLTGILTLTAALGAVWLTNRSQGNRDVAQRAADREAADWAYKAAVQDAKRERLREGFTDLLVTSRALVQRAAHLGWITNDPEAKQELDRQVDEMMIRGLDRSIASLLLEPEAGAVVRLFDDLRRSYIDFRFALEDASQGQSSANRPFGRMAKALQDLEKNTPQLEQLARTALVLMERPPLPLPRLAILTATSSSPWWRRFRRNR